MKKTYSTYEAKARLSEILRQVRETGETITVTDNGRDFSVWTRRRSLGFLSLSYLSSLPPR